MTGKRKHWVAFLLCTAMLILLAAPGISAAGGWEYSFPENAASVSITLNGKKVLERQAAIIDSTTYVPLRRFGELMGADDIRWDAKTRTASIVYGGNTIKVTDGSHLMSAGGRYFYTDATVKNIDDRLFVPIRPLATAFGLSVNWHAETRTVELKSVASGMASASKVYNSDDLYWLSRIIYAEAGGESLRGQIAVGNVVLNRKASRSYPNTVYGVIFDRKGGVQFTPVANGMIYKTPSETSVIAAKICLEGYTVSVQALYFMNPRLATSNWIAQNCTYLFTIGNHSFYA